MTSTTFKQKVFRPWNSCDFLVPVLRGCEMGAFSHCVAQVHEGFLTQPSCHLSPRTQMSPLTALWQVWFWLGGALCISCNRQRETFLPGAWQGGYSLSVPPTLPFCRKGGWVCRWLIHPSLWRGSWQQWITGVHAAHLSLCYNIMRLWLIAFFPRTASFVCLHHGAKAAWSQSPVLSSLSPRLRVSSVVCSWDSPHLLQKGDCVLWPMAWQQQGWGR